MNDTKSWIDYLQVNPSHPSRIYPKAVQIGSRYLVQHQWVDQNGVVNIRPKFLDWSLISAQHIIDPSCILNLVSTGSSHEQ